MEITCFLKYKFLRRLILFFCFLVGVSCHNKKTENLSGTYAPKIIKVKIDTVQKEKVTTVRIIPVDFNKLKKVVAGKPLIVPAFNSTHIAGIPKVVVAGQPKKITPGTDTFSLPTKIAVTEKPIIAGIPEIVVAKDMTYKIPNPASFSSFGKLQGLKYGIVTCLLQDKLGNLWICTPGGVSKYDGHFFTTYTAKEGLAISDVRSVLQDKSGNIWFGTLGGGVSEFDGVSFTNFTITDGLVDGHVVNMIQDKAGNIWFATWGGVTKYDGHSFTNFTTKQGLVDNFVESVLEDRSGNILFGTRGGVSRFDGKTFTNFTTKEGLSNNDVYSMIMDKSGKIWFGTIGGGVSIYDGITFIHLTTKEGLINDELGTILEDKHGTFWIGTHEGLSGYDGHSFTNFTDKNGLSSANIYCSLQDNKGNLWFGTGSGGVIKYNPNSFTHFTEYEGLNKNYVFSIYEDKSEKLWMGMWRGGVTEYNGVIFKNFTQSQGLTDNDVRNIYQDKNGSYWFATFKGVSKYDGHSFVHLTEKEGLINNDVNCIIADHSGNIWFGTEGGASKFDGSSITNYFQKTPVYCIKQDSKGNLWFGTSDGIYKYDGSTFYHLNDEERIIYVSPLCINEDKSENIWFGTSKGAYKYDGQFITQLTEKEGLISDFIVSIMEDSFGNLWFGNRFGISELTPDKSALFFQKLKLNKIKDDEIFFKNYRYLDNFLGIGCSRDAIIESKDHHIWIGTNGGVTTFNPLAELKDSIPPNIQITSIQLFNKDIDWINLKQHKDTSFLINNGAGVKNFHFDSLSRWYHLPQNLSLAHDNNYISFDFVGITMNQPQNVKYQYELEGLDNSMSAVTSETSASYGNLSPGYYTFKVKAMNSEGYWSKEAAFSFTIRPPWWKTWWFRVLATVIIVALIFIIVRSIYNYQLQKQKIVLEKQLAIQYERQRISSDLHDEIGSTLSSVNIYLGLAKKEPSNPFYLDSINQNVNEVMSKLDDLVWSIKPTQDSLGKIAERLTAYAESAARIKGIAFMLNMDHQLDEQQLHPDTKHHLYMVIKELINNAIKHSGCNQIFVAITNAKGQLMISVKDNGSGFDMETARQDRNGLKNIRERTNEMKAKLDIQSKNGEGTEVTIAIPT